VHVFRRRGPFVFDAWPELARVENCPPRRNAPVEALGVLLGELPPWPNKRPGVEDTGGERGGYRARAPHGGVRLRDYHARPKSPVRLLALRALISSPIPWLFPWGRLGNLGPSVVQVAPRHVRWLHRAQAS
jgi:hypothetical protein